MIKAKKNLDDAYLEAGVDFINGKINTLSMENISRKHPLAWKTVKELSGKNSTSNVSLKGGSAKKHLENWSKNLLGKKAELPAINTLPSEQIPHNLNIDISLFRLKS